MTKRDLARLTKFRDMIVTAYKVMKMTERIIEDSKLNVCTKWFRCRSQQEKFINLVGVMVKKELRRGKR